jgi:hypothetical protein
LDWRDIPGWFGWREGQEEACVHFADGSTFVEVGLYLGRSICSLVEAIVASGKQIAVVGVDTCRGSGPEGPDAVDVHAPAVAEGGGTLAGTLHKNLLACGGDAVTLVVADSVRASQLWPDASLEWVHLDARHDYESVRADILGWLPKVRPGGWLTGDDLNDVSYPGVVQAVADLLPGAQLWCNGQWRWKVPARQHATTARVVRPSPQRGPLQPTDCISADFEAAWYEDWSRAIDLPPARHAKFWELCAIAEALKSRGMLEPGRVGLGMGVGLEQLASLFAAQGCRIVATDQDPDDEKAQQWDNAQLAHSRDDVFYPHIVDRQQFESLVVYEPYDMLSFEERYVGQFDFIWHNCSIGHLGSLANSAEQLLRSAAYLRDGGWLVFTTELNIASIHSTVHDDSQTVLWRLEDLRLLFDAMREEGLQADPLLLRLGDRAEDCWISRDLTDIDVHDPHAVGLKITFGRFALTQILLAFQKRAGATDLGAHDRAWAYNYGVLATHLHLNRDLSAYYVSHPDTAYLSAEIEPVARVVELVVPAGGEGEVELAFENRSDLTVYDCSFTTPYLMPHLVVGTSDPANRESELAHPSWSSSNRPAVSFAEPGDGGRAHRADPGEAFAYRFLVRAPTTSGTYAERFAPVFEGVGDLPDAQVEVRLTVV